MSDFITYHEAIRTFGLRATWRMMRKALGIKRQLAPWPSKEHKRGKKQTGDAHHDHSRL